VAVIVAVLLLLGVGGGLLFFKDKLFGSTEKTPNGPKK
jgi:hypothetical protein